MWAEKWQRNRAQREREREERFGESGCNEGERARERGGRCWFGRLLSFASPLCFQCLHHSVVCTRLRYHHISLQAAVSRQMIRGTYRELHERVRSIRLVLQQLHLEHAPKLFEVLLQLLLCRHSSDRSNEDTRLWRSAWSFGIAREELLVHFRHLPAHNQQKTPRA